jgi:hypothetical protein
MALALTPSLGGATTPPRITSGLHGVVTRGPTRPLCLVEDPCDGPAVGFLLQFRRLGQVVASVRTGAGGVYSVRLRPGMYTAGPLHVGIGKGLTPRVVRVPVGRVARVDFHLDTGIQ